MTSAIPRFQTSIGKRFPSGATWSAAGTNFSIFSYEAHNIELLLYDTAESLEPFQVITLNPKLQRTFFSWHVFVEKLPAGTYYTWRMQKADGTWWHILDPYARAVSDVNWNRNKAISATNGLRGIVADTYYDRRNTGFTPKSLDGAVIYEVHVGGFTKHPSSGVKHPGTFSGFIEKIPYLKELGITHVELLPVMAFDEQDVPAYVADVGNKNYWGYSPYGFYAPHPGYCITENAVAEFRELVLALHSADIGIILDVVFNHTSEGGKDGPTIHFKALAGDIFYHHDGQNYRDYTGCGNTINCNHPLVTHFFVHCLEYWAQIMMVDGFRFDLASVFSRGEDGEVLANPFLPWSIELSSALAQTPLIAEAWDAAGLYQVGCFPGSRWSEWNGRYRDVVRRFVRGDRGLVGDVATCLAGSSDLYEAEYRLPTSSINFVTCHDGFTLWDLVSYNQKHNEANGEDNRDGCNQNLSWNCGVEGESNHADILALRRQQARNFMAILFLSQGVPMFLAGDEFLHSQDGNNNVWCQDNELAWLDWTQAEKNKDMVRFVRELIAFRRRHPCLNRSRFFESASDKSEIVWHGPKLNMPEWGNYDAQILAATLAGSTLVEEDLHIVLNMSDDDIDVSLPELSKKHWHRALDTAAKSPDDLIEPTRQKKIRKKMQSVHARSVVVFEARG